MASLQQSVLDGLSSFKTWLYGVGHVFNDLCAACWFNYVLYYLANVEQVSNSAAGAVVLAGQIADGIATPLVGLYSDKFTTRFGRRKPWYMFGTILVPFCFFFIWQTCFPCMALSGTGKTALEIVWYSFFAAFFNVGWAAVQVSHLALIPTLTPIKERKDKLIGLRTAFTYLSNITVLLFALLLFNVVSDPKIEFSLLSIIVLAVGVSINITFILFINENLLADIASESYRTLESLLLKAEREKEAGGTHSIEAELPERSLESQKDIIWSEWLRYRQLYIIGVVYMMARLANNAVTAMLPFYLTTVLNVGGVDSPSKAADKTPWQLALIPMCLYIGSAGMSMLLKKLGEKLNKKLQYFIGVVFVLIGAVPMIFLDSSTEYLMIPIAIIIGIGLSFELNNSFSFIAAFIGAFGTSGAFVWGFISLFDKMCTGITLFFVVSFGDLTNSTYIRIVVAGIPIFASVVAILTTIFIEKTQEFTVNTVQALESNEETN